MRYPWKIAGAIAATAALAAPPAGAAVYDRFSYSGSESFTDAPCGYPLDVTFSYQGRLVIRETRGGQAFRVRDTGSFRTVFTNPATDQWLVIRGHTTINEVKARLVDGTVYAFVDHEAGQAFVLEDSDGNVIARDRGLIRTQYQFDTLGDGVPGGQEVGDPVVTLHGPHPAFADDFPFCEIFDELLS